MIHGSMPTVCTNVGWSQQDASASRSGSPRANRRVETNGNRLARAVPPTSPTVSVTSGGGFASGGLASMAKEEDDWRIDWSEVLLERLIGSGAAGMTYAAQWQGATVAVKIATPCASGRESWRAEVRALTRLHHPNVVRCLGTIVAPPTYCLVLEYCDGGDVRQALNQPPTPTMFFWRVAEGVASGMAYLHRKNVLHCDLKTSNILIDQAGGVRVTDFGLAVTSLPDRALAAAPGLGTLRYMAPEVVRREAYGPATDVYGFALVLFELITREVPFDGWSAEHVSALVALRGRRPRLPNSTPPSVEALIQQCWQDNAAERLAFADVQHRLTTIRKSISKAELDWLDDPYGHRAPSPPEASDARGMPHSYSPGGLPC